MHIYEEDYIDFMGHKYDRTRSKFNGKPLFEEGEISVPQCAKLFGVKAVEIYYRVSKGMIPHMRKGNTIVLSYDACMEYFTRETSKQMELINDN